ncbi:hypothetical protein HJC23_012026 [Cyclotella cryptica]|uniref:DOT1 domain-containing protein n=1 Tax=Cyclotella cryptica TaxID=29204 RepID=A0ABD3PWA7_9STRA|eukprot:CCRYP_012326-RA/>CCRYP_012326-RA protein AED:0.00 eAED:0.00 QI:176/-1/1/1/-1/1/1/74/410
MLYSSRLLWKTPTFPALGAVTTCAILFCFGSNRAQDCQRERCSTNPTEKSLIAKGSFLPCHTGCFLLNRSFRSSQNCQCESDKLNSSSIPSPVVPKPLSRYKLLLYRSKLLPHSFLPVPRLLTPSDPLFAYPEFQKGLRLRQDDERRLNRLLTSTELKEARLTQNQEQLHSILSQMHTLLYGEGVTPQVREDFLIQYGCTGFTPEILEYLMDLGSKRGFVEIGAGNGQWARALTDCHVGYCQRNANQSSDNSSDSSSSWEFVHAYDNMKDLPLSPKIYHSKTIPAHRHFYPNVKYCPSHTDAVKTSASRGRVLLLVFPPPGPMAIETVQAYVNAHEENDTVVYVGEGRGGANGNNELFRYFLGKLPVGDEQIAGNQDAVMEKWVLLNIMDVRTCPGGKGYEKMFVFQRLR